MATSGTVRRKSDHQIILDNVRWCDYFLCKLKGLMFRRDLGPGEGLLMVEVTASRVTTSIHMLFMFMPLGILWLDSDMRVVDMVLAQPWRLAYFPSKAAQYVLETSPMILQHVVIGDSLQFESHEAT